MPQNGVWNDRMIDLKSGMIGTIIDWGNWLSQIKVQELKFVQKVSPNQEVETLVYIHFLIIECDFARLVIQVQEWQVWNSKLTLKYCSDRVTQQESILIQKFKLDHKFENLGHIFLLSSIS